MCLCFNSIFSVLSVPFRAIRGRFFSEFNHGRHGKTRSQYFTALVADRVKKQRIRRERLAAILRAKAEEDDLAFAHFDLD